MRERLATAFVLGAFLGAMPCGTVRALELADDRGALVRLAAPATRIVALAPHLAEAVFAAGAGERLVGTVLFSDYPEAARAVPRVGDAARIDLERILALQPDLILAWRSGNQAGDVRRLERLGQTVFVTEPARLADVPRLIRVIGRFAGTAQSAEESAARFERDIAALRERHAGRRPVRVFYEIWHQPLLTVDGRHLISDVLRLCGGTNVFADAGTLTPNVALESVLAAQPEAIVGGASGATADAFATEWRRRHIRTLESVSFVHVEADWMQRASPRLAQGARAVCEGLERVRALRG